jgi:rod shape-determining protein MreC
MMRDRAARRHIITYAVLVSVSLLLLAFSNTAPLQTLRSAVNYALAPVEEVLAGASRSMGGVFTAVAEADQLRRDNLALRSQVATMQQQITQYEAVKIESARLAKLLHTQSVVNHTTQPAFVVRRQSTQFERVLILDRGADAGLQRGDPVLSDGGALVGVITDVGPNYADVRLLSDTRSLVIGRDSATRSTGEVTGHLSAPLQLGKVPGTQQLSVGDTIVTAGDEAGTRSLLPKGLLIGSIVQVQAGAQFLVSSALVAPAADLDALETVLVITDFKPPTLPNPNATPGPDATPQPTPKPTPKVKPSKGP